MPVYQKLDKNGKSKKNKDGIILWYFRDYYTDMYGNRKQYKSGCFAGKQLAIEEERKWLDNILKKDNTDNNVYFINIYDEWLNFRKRQLKESTYSDFVYRADKYLKTFFKDYKLHAIKINTINSWYDNLDNQPLSIDYKNTIVGYLKNFFEYCRDNYDFDNKVVAKIIKYRNDTPLDKLQDSEWNFWCYDEWEEFINVVDNYDYKMMYIFLYYTGLRFGEFDALNWHDFDPVNKTIKVTKTLSTKCKGKKFVIQSPKTDNSVRVVDLDDDLNESLIEYKKYKENKYYGFNDDNYIFGDIKYVAHTTFRRHLDKYINKVKEIREDFKRITAHGFRHSHVSLLIELGCDSRDVAERIGDTIQMVEETYYHMFPKKKKLTVDKLNNLKNKT